MVKSRVFSWLSAFLLLVSAAAIVILTFQSKEQTGALSHTVWDWFRAHGFRGSEHEIRSWAHVPEYFIFGCTLTLFGLSRGWGKLRIFAFGALFGLLDECVKIPLPFREFDFGDWTKDLIGVALAIFFLSVLIRIVSAGNRKTTDE